MHAPSLKYHNGTFYFYWNGIAYAWIESEPLVNIRSIKLLDKVIVMLNGKQVL